MKQNLKSSKVASTSKTIIGAIAGDIIGSLYERKNIKSVDIDIFLDKSKFTDDTVLTVAVANSIMNEQGFKDAIWEFGRKYPDRGYGSQFKKWLKSNNPQPYKSLGNGSAMRVSAVGFAYNSIEEVLVKAKESAEVSHNHPEGIKGAQAIATSIFLARNGKSKQEIKKYITDTFDYDIDFKLEDIRPSYKFDVTCMGSVPQAIVAFLESSDYENSIRLAISIGGDSDTIACMTGGIAAAFYKKIPKSIMNYVEKRLPEEFIEIINEFDEKFNF